MSVLTSIFMFMFMSGSSAFDQCWKKRYIFILFIIINNMSMSRLTVMPMSLLCDYISNTSCSAVYIY